MTVVQIFDQGNIFSPDVLSPRRQHVHRRARRAPSRHPPSPQALRARHQQGGPRVHRAHDHAAAGARDGLGYGGQASSAVAPRALALGGARGERLGGQPRRIEHLPKCTLACFTPVLLGAYHSRLLLLTTPSYTYNTCFTAPDAPPSAHSGWRDPTQRTDRVFWHHDHQFEWTMDERAHSGGVGVRAARDWWALEGGGGGRVGAGCEARVGEPGGGVLEAGGAQVGGTAREAVGGARGVVRGRDWGQGRGGGGSPAARGVSAPGARALWASAAAGGCGRARRREDGAFLGDGDLADRGVV